ncbi:MAG: DUF2924 domain-containing protein [Sphingobium sp.]|nr:MAG: DUF2924 domain-containing protein [Sphingobium sp.]
MRGADEDIGLQLTAIPNLSLPDLLEQWRALGFGEAPRLPLPLVKRLLAQLVQEQTYGGLSASAMRKLDAAAYVDESGIAVGSSSPSASSKHSACPTGAHPSPTFSSSPPVPRRPSRPSPPLRQVTLATGTRLVREWNGRTISVDVVGDGFVWNDVRYRSLSEIARTVTGTRWSGPRFFGIAGRG